MSNSCKRAADPSHVIPGGSWPQTHVTNGGSWPQSRDPCMEAADPSHVTKLQEKQISSCIEHVTISWCPTRAPCAGFVNQLMTKKSSMFMGSGTLLWSRDNQLTGVVNQLMFHKSSMSWVQVGQAGSRDHVTISWCLTRAPWTGVQVGQAGSWDHVTISCCLPRAPGAFARVGQAGSWLGQHSSRQASPARSSFV